MWIAHRAEFLITAGKFHFLALVGRAGTNHRDDSDQRVDIMHVAHFAERDHGRTFDVVHGASVADGDEAPNGRIVPGTHGRGKSEGRGSKSEKNPKTEIRSGGENRWDTIDERRRIDAG